jgi:4-carboxymuconolactone decarboxylase
VEGSHEIPQEEEQAMTTRKDLFDDGMAIRREVLGAEHVDRSMQSADDFNLPFQELITEYAWGAVWGRPGLERKTRSMLNLVMLTALNRPHELELHVRGALTNGVTRDEMREIFMHASVYCGVPAALDAFRVARKIFAELDSAASE